MPAVLLHPSRAIGPGQLCYLIAEIGINYNGSPDLAKQLRRGRNAVKFQKRTPKLCVPKDQWEKPRDTPWGRLSYLDYKRKTKFGLEEYTAIDDYCKLMLSTGMSTQQEITDAVKYVGFENLMIAHSTSAYPCPPRELNLRMVQTLLTQFPGTPIGYSGHETGLSTTVTARP